MPSSLLQPNTPSGLLMGPGIVVQIALSSAAVAGDTLDLSLSAGPVGEERFVLATHYALSAGETGVTRYLGNNKYLVPVPLDTWSNPQVSVTDGTRAILEMSWRDSSFAPKEDITFTGFTWSNTQGIYAVLQDQQGGQFTSTDRATLATVESTASATRSAVTTTVTTAAGTLAVDIGSAFRWISHDLFADHPLTIGPTCDPIDLDVSLNALYGVTLTIDTVPDDVQWRTPDGEWSFRDLAVIRFVLNGSILQRHGVHTLSHVVSPLPAALWFGAFGLNAPIQPTGYHIQVDWAAGVCGHLTGQILPI